MAWKCLSAFVGMAFGELNVAPRNQTLLFKCCKKILKHYCKAKIFQNKQIMAFMLCVTLVTSLHPKVCPLNYISFGFVMLMRCVEGISKECALNRLAFPSLWLM